MSVPTPLVGIVVPHHPEGPRSVRYLVDALDSVAMQGRDDVVVAVAFDPVPGRDAESDWLALLEIARRRPSVHPIRLATPSGPGGARNAGTWSVLCLGVRYVAYLDSDDVCEPDRINRTIQAFEDDASAGVVFSAFSLIDEDSRPWAHDELPVGVGEIYDSLVGLGPVVKQAWLEMACVRGYFCLTSTTAVRADIARRCPFPETFVSEDTHTWFRMFAEAEVVRYLSRPLVRYRVPRIPAGSASRARAGRDFYWTKAVVDLDGLCRVLLSEVGSGRLDAVEAEAVLEQFWRRMGTTMAACEATAPLAVAKALGRLGDLVEVTS